MKINNLYILSVISVLFFATCSNPVKQTATQDEANTEYPSILEIIAGTDTLSSVKLKEVCIANGIDTTSIYQWKNHLIIYSKTEDNKNLQKQVSEAYPDAEIKYYDSPYYIFDRANCDNKETASEWSHTIMTANLVSDTTMQKEYMDYHATQSEKFPEVANGFCKADFQQLLMFRNSRQLMLIISIPKGENLDDLNPKTTEDNPRVDEWNAIMAKYQEGIEGSDGNTWVVFDNIK
ncbi:L-rhamnose mutarotase [Dysgonomonas sp. 520]|uniref:L-rhamnose mutarotase n=1 Tax=Dysgonomonas sp. 520 TaxID=2302931 RepID=UPI0013D32D80|nr:L-rhamnose mutarotase [Dysgonomonas sp. 520]NDW09699.1 L-rhamnose mutarotase [Dysgonomonas sp. 520]